MIIGTKEQIVMQRKTRIIFGVVGLIVVLAILAMAVGMAVVPTKRTLIYPQKTQQDIPPLKPYHHVMVIPPYY